MADKFTERENYILDNSINIEWFLQAINKNNPLHPEEGAAHTESHELDGQNILVPRVRIKDGKAIVNKENALEEALEKGDYIVVPEGEDPDQYSKDLSKLIGKFRGFNKGGTPMEKQMDLFEDGGLKDEGGLVDEESGNDVPVGSTKKEVRDDIPAMLSEGEFVLPADVVRYHGLEKIMQLRDEAKFGLKKMEAMGQMGNSDEATLDDDVPFGPADLIIVGAEPMEDEPREMYQGGVVHAQAGTFVKPSTGIAGYQPSIYQGQQTTGAYTPPPSSVAPPIPAPSPAGGYVPKFVSSGQIPVGVAPPPITPPSSTDTSAVSTASTEDKPFVPTVNDVYTSVEYINPETSERRMFSFYNGAVVNGPIPEGFIPVTELETSQTGTDTTTGTGIDDTSVATTQVATDDGDDQTIRELQRKQQQRENEQLSLQKTNLLQKGSANDLVSAWLDNKRVLGAGNVGAFFSPLIGVLTTAAGLKEQRDIESALTERFGEDWKTTAKLTDEVKQQLTDYEESGKLRNTKLFGNKLFEDVKAAVSGIKDSFTEEGRQSYYENYASSGPVHNVSDNTLSGGVTGFEAVVDGSGKLEMNQNGMPKSSGNLSIKEQQAYDNAVSSGNSSVANHHAIIAKHRAGQDNYANAVAKYGADSIQAQNAGKGMSSHSKEQAIKYGGSVHKAKENGTASKTNTSGTGFFAKYKTEAEQKEDNDNDSSSSGAFGGYSCYVATALNDKGYWPTVKKIKLIKWCMDTKPEHKFDTKLWRNGYTVFGKTIIAPRVDNKIIRWLSDGFYEATVKNKKSVKSLIGLLFFYIPSYTIALYKMLRNDLVDIERT